MLVIKDVNKSFQGKLLFEDVAMSVNWGERIALVGPNGAGKSTLINMLLGKEEVDQGTLQIEEYALVGYLAQEAGDPSDKTILQIALSIDEEMSDAIVNLAKAKLADDTESEAYLKALDVFESNDGYRLEPKAKKILAGLGFKQDDFDQLASTFSGGWIMRAHLAQLLVKEPDLLILDEPTNHLDLLSLIWFQQYLKNTFPGALLMISHDRDFMDGLIEKVYDIDNHTLVGYSGNYSDFLQQREKRYEQMQQRYREQQKEISRVQEFVDKFRSVSSKASQVQTRIKQIQKLKDALVKPVMPRKMLRFQFPQPPSANQRVVELKNISQSYSEKTIYQNLDLTIEKGDKIVLVGPNGAGKSTLLKILAKIVPIDDGEVVTGLKTKMGYFSQHRAAAFDLNNTVLEEVLKANPHFSEQDARSILGSFLFRKQDVAKKINVLSGGEKSRLNLVQFLVNPPNLLLMDEPTTHLDILSIEALTYALKQYQGTLVFISHDVHFIKNLAEKTLHINQGIVTPYSGGYDYYIEKSGLLDDRAAVVT